MQDKTKAVLTAILDITPEPIRRAVLCRGSRWYDNCYLRADDPRNGNLSASPYLRLYEAAGKLVSGRAVVELGCGTGHFAEFCQLMGMQYRRGMDFSRVAVDKARLRWRYRESVARSWPAWRDSSRIFFRADLEKPIADALVFADVPPGVLVCLEVLEHLGNDRGLIERMPHGAELVASVPKFYGREHVRRFADYAAVRNRYAGLLDIEEMMEVDAHFILFTGIRR